MSFDVRVMPVGPVTTNCYVLFFSEQVFLIDPGGDPGHILAILGGKQISTILLTHGHYDHIGALPQLKREFPRAVVAIHRMEEPFLSDPALNLSGLFDADFSYPLVPECLLDDGSEILLPDLSKGRVIHTPGHTPGSICFLVGESLLFTGDTLFRESVGRCDLPGGNERQLLASIKEKLMVLPDEIRVLPGHMDESTIGHERLSNPFIAE